MKVNPHNVWQVPPTYTLSYTYISLLGLVLHKGKRQ